MRVLDHVIDRQPAEVELDLGADYRDLEVLLRESDSVSLQGVPESSLTITETPAQNQCASYGTAHAQDWLAHGLGGRSPTPVTKSQNVLEPILTVIGARKLQDLTAADVRQALAAMAAGYSTGAVTMGHLAVKRAIRHAEANDLVSRNVGALADSPKGQHARPSKSLTLDQAAGGHHRRQDPAGDGTAPRPQGCPPPRRAHARLHRAQPASRGPHRRGPALRWQHVDLDGNPAASPPVPPHVAVWRSVRLHGETKTERSRRTLDLPAVAVQALRALRETQAEERLTAGDSWQDTGLVFTTQRGAALDAGNVRKMFKRICIEAGIGDSWTPRELRTSFVSLMSHHGVSIEEIARLVGHASARTTEIVYRRELRPVITTGAEIMDQLFTGTQPSHQARIPPRTCTGQPPIPGYLWNSTSGPWPAKAPLKRPWKV